MAKLCKVSISVTKKNTEKSNIRQALLFNGVIKKWVPPKEAFKLENVVPVNFLA